MPVSTKKIKPEDFMDAVIKYMGGGYTQDRVAEPLGISGAKFGYMINWYFDHNGEMPQKWFYQEGEEMQKPGLYARSKKTKKNKRHIKGRPKMSKRAKQIARAERNRTKKMLETDLSVKKKGAKKENDYPDLSPSSNSN